MNGKNILSFWRDLEVFNLPDLEKNKLLLKSGATLPWLQKLTPSNPDKVWRYTLYFGSLAKKDIIQKIESISDSREIKERIEPATGKTFVAALILDELGRPDPKSYFHASYVHGINCVAEKKSVEEVNTRLTRVQEDYEIRFAIPQPTSEEEENRNRKGLIVTWKLIEDEIAYLQKLTKFWNAEEFQVFYDAKEVSKKSEPEPAFLNSFFLDDLNFLFKTNEPLGNGLNEYLSIQTGDNNRLDVIANKNHLVASIDPANMPAGRWPANLKYGLYTAQLGAVCTTLKDLTTGGGIRGINGPPGTGKTTLLKDIIADVVVQRAESILRNKKLFGKYSRFEHESGYNNHFYEVDADVFSNRGIVVSSNNNAAVENITKELPSSKNLDKDLIAGGYFSECSQRLIDEPSWGILSAALGNAANRSTFVNNFWNNGFKANEIGFKELISSVYKNAENNKTDEMLKKYEEVKAKLCELLNEFKIFKKEASFFHSLLHAHIKNRKLAHALPAEIEKVHIELIDELKIENGITDKIAKANDSIQQLHDSIRLQNSQKPFLFIFQLLVKTKAYMHWKESADFYSEELKKTSKEKSILREQLLMVEKKISFLKAEIIEKQSILKKAEDNINMYENNRSTLIEKYGFEKSNLVDEDFYSLSLGEMHLCNPYSSVKINKLRSEIFTTSLDVHKYAILSHAKYFRNNLETFFSVISGRIKVDKKIALQLWDTFFFCVPVVSTSLASVSRLFSLHNKETIGWLLLDEAGQATPQSAAGIIWRSKRSIIIGDPLQIEPVVTISENLVQYLRTQNNIDELTWSPLVSSVQMLADRISKLGSYMIKANSDEKVWTGFPLRTHRRCIEPMFSIANEIAYSNQMVNEAKDEKDNIAKSTWYDVAGTEIFNKQVVKEELEQLTTKILELRNNNYKDQIFVISPFKSIARACEDVLREFKNVQCGTIHTFQGKEADVVFLILGSDPSTQGARLWASQKPNMLNVALTRAKKRFYVIGNKSLWSQCNYFNVMAKRLE